ncbi:MULTISPECIES: cytochrome b [Sinorhizobium]|uniref:Cytochrome B n=1 Tax=Sinorhizobium americanum TaxID=194963 RepID=A0A2S3YW26_9HYPH|nr:MULTISPECIES: cytochrome b [Sinorhizobium]PDT39928.1 cytochrome b [Sinorhizobium sp. FG01]POH35849.1 cytochrome B [Sinorhizobium americanum]
MLRNRENGFGTVTIVLHWTIALLILGLMLVGFAMRRTELDPALQFSLYQWHKSLGLTALGLALLRALWWLAERTPQPVPGLHPFEYAAARQTHRILILLGVIVPLAGWAVASASTLNMPSFYFNIIVIPHLPLPQSESAEAFWARTHALLAYVMLVLVAIHAVAALYHQFVRGDEVLIRMLRSASSRSDAGPVPGGETNRPLAGRNDP